MGARREDYQRISPPGSFIHVDDFRDPQHLAEYLHDVDRNFTLYSQYFRWKVVGRFIDTKFYCRLCSLLYTDHITWYTDIGSWWNTADMCVESSQGNYFSSWTTGISEHQLKTTYNEESFTIKWPNDSIRDIALNLYN